MEAKPLISVIIPAYNVEDYIEKSVNSILGQELVNLEVLIADDCSSDSTRTIIDKLKEKDERIKTFHNEKNLGVVATRNKLIKQAEGEYIATQDADDWSHPQRLKKQLALFEKFPDLGACGTQMIKTTDDAKELYRSQYPTSYEEILTKVTTVPWQCPSLMVRRAFIVSLGGYNEFFARVGNEDVYLISILVLNHKFLNTKDHLYYYRYNPNSLTKTYIPNNLKQQYIPRITQKLVVQYRESGSNWLEEKDMEALAVFEAELAAPYRQDPSLIYREFAGQSIYWKEYLPAVRYAWGGVRAAPQRFINYRTLFYCLRQIHLLWK